MLEYKQVTTRSGKTGYVELGFGEPLILVVGYSGTLYHWNGKFVNELAKSYKLYLIDNRKIGLSDSGNEESIKGFSEDVIDFIDALGLVKPAILGWSMGGVVVQELLKAYEHKVSSAILLATLPNMQYMVPGFFELVANASRYNQVEFRKKLYHYFFSKDDYDAVKDVITSNALPLLAYRYRFSGEAKILQDTVIPNWNGVSIEELEKIKLPVLLLSAKDDLVVNEEAARFTFAKLSLAKMITYSKGGHFLIQEAPVEIASDITGFLKRNNEY